MTAFAKPRRLAQVRPTVAMWFGCLALLLGAAGLAFLMVGLATFRLAFVAAVLVLVLGIWAIRPIALLPFLLVWTVALGLVRRLVTFSILGTPTSIDPLLLIGPLAIILLAVSAAGSGRRPPQTALSRAVLALAALVCVEALNPLQGGVTVGLAALIFFVPILAFWIGRTLVDDRGLRGLFTLLAVCALPVVGYGLLQLNSGLPSWDSSWAVVQGYAALNVGGAIRQFSSLSSAAEYATFLAIAVVVWAWMRPFRAVWFLRLAVIVTLLIALFYESSRGIVFLLVGASGLVIAAKLGMRMRNAVVVGLVAIFLLPVVASRLLPQQSTAVPGTTSALVAHETTGLADPTNSSTTLSVHASLVLAGLRSAFTSPAGHGISVVTIAGNKFGGANQNTETDVSNVGVAMGIAGLAVFLAIIWIGFRSAYDLALVRKDPLAYAALGILGVTFLQWLTGGQYAIAYLPWLILGWVDRQMHDRATGLALRDDVD
jgi:hypothetical protein